MNFGLADKFSVFSFEVLNSNDIEVVSGGSGGGSGLMDALQAVGGLGFIAAGLGGAYGAMSGAAVSGLVAAGLLTGGVVLALAGGVMIGAAAYSYFG